MRLPNPTGWNTTITAINSSTQAANNAWKDACYEAIKEACRRWNTFTSEDITDLLEQAGYTTHEPRAMGGMILKAKADQLIEPTSERVWSHRETSNKYMKTVWKSRYKPNGTWAA